MGPRAGTEIAWPSLQTYRWLFLFAALPHPPSLVFPEAPGTPVKAGHCLLPVYMVPSVHSVLLSWHTPCLPSATFPIPSRLCYHFPTVYCGPQCPISAGAVPQPWMDVPQQRSWATWSPWHGQILAFPGVHSCSVKTEEERGSHLEAWDFLTFGSSTS
jgi:hypothetical protein